MTKPSIAELLIASGHTDFNWPLVRQAIQTLYGDVGANLDERDWSAIMAANNPMAVAEQALKDQWQDAAYLLRNADHLISQGYSPVAVEFTYRQMAERLDFTYDASWSAGTQYEWLGALSDEELAARAAAESATFSVNWTDTSDGQLLDLRHLTVGAIITFVNDDVRDDWPDTIYGGDGDDVFINGEYIDEWGADLWGPVYGQAGTDEIRFGGTWNDGVDGAINGVELLTLSSAASVTLDNQTEAFTIRGSSGDDTIVAGAGADTINGGAGADTITGGSGLDSITGGAGADVIRIGAVGTASTDTVVGFVSGADKVEVLSSLLLNGTNSATLNTTSIAAWTARLGSLGANDIFVEFTDDTGAPGSCDEASEVAALLTAGASGGTQFNALFDFHQSDKVVLFLHDGTDGYLWHWSEAALGDGNVDASELTLLVKLVGVTDITNGDLAVYV